jgi:hypothetical protein
VRCVLLIELDCFFGRHSVVFNYIEGTMLLMRWCGVVGAVCLPEATIYPIYTHTRVCQDDSMCCPELVSGWQLEP